MKNKNVGSLIIGISVIIGIIVLLFNFGLRKIVSQTCVHGPSCTMYDTIALQTWISLVIAGLILVIGLFLIFSKEHEKIVIKKIRPYGELKPKKFNKKSLEKLTKDEAKVMNLILENNGNIFQSELSERTGFNKVKITRMLDGLEGQGLIERKRRGMTNIVILKA